MRFFYHGFRGRIGASLFVCSTSIMAGQPAPVEDSIELEVGGVKQELASWEQQYLVHAVDRLYDSCSPDNPDEEGVVPEPSSNELSVIMKDGRQRLIQMIGDSSKSGVELEIYELKGKKVQRLNLCSGAYMLPVASIIEARMLPVATTMEADTRYYEQPPARIEKSAGLTSYKPNRVGWTFDSNDVNSGYLDMVISVKYPLFNDGRYHPFGENYNPNLYLAFTGRFSQYIETIESSPVVGKQFNPKLFSRWWLGDDSRYLDIGIAHESNGQSITTEEAYQSERESFAQSDGDANFARNYISRGWDYLSLDWTHSWHPFAEEMNAGDQAILSTGESAKLNSYVMLKYFMDDGPLQGNPEEYNDWENDGVNKRKQYDGISFLGKYSFSKHKCLARQLGLDWERDVCLQELSWQYTTGYDGMFDNNTHRAEFAIEFWGLPVMLWAQTGYNSDLVDYYKNVDSWGIALELESGQFLGL